MIRPVQACAKRQKVLGAREPAQNQKENRNPLLPLPGAEERGAQGLVSAETRKIRRFYLDHIVEHELLKAPGPYRAEFLARHGVTPEIRARMVL